jgi:hypothetical protein
VVNNPYLCPAKVEINNPKNLITRKPASVSIRTRLNVFVELINKKQEYGKKKKICAKG